MSTVNELKQERAELQQRLDAIKADYRRGLSADSGERAVELENADTLMEIQRITQERIATIDEQLSSLRGLRG